MGFTDFSDMQEMIYKILGYAGRISWVGGFMFSGLIALLWYYQEKLLFYPTVPEGFETPEKNPAGFRSPTERGMECETVWITTSDGIKLHAWLIKQKGGKHATAPTLLYFHGNAGNMGFRLPNIESLYLKCGVNILAVSYRGYGWSEGKPTEYGVYRDAEAALNFLLSRNDIDSSKLSVFGRSIGGAVAINLAYARPNVLRGVIVENTFTSLYDMVHLVFPFFRPFRRIVKYVQRMYMDNSLKVPNIEVPMMFICGQKDNLVPTQQMMTLYEASASPLKSLLLVPDGGHNDTWEKGGENYYARIAAFIENTLPTLTPSSAEAAAAAGSVKKSLYGEPEAELEDGKEGKTRHRAPRTVEQ